MNQIIKVGIGIMILNDNKILLGHRTEGSKDTGGIYQPGSWCLPGGKQEYQETIFECAARETKEETNLEISNMKIFGATDDIRPDRHFVTIWVLALENKGILEVMEPDKQDEWQWFDLNNLPKNLYSPSRKFIEAYIENKKQEKVIRG
ncbi:MAG: NUDIX domain-containing protein [Firmicutes bacterium]|jgi:8-oxo-dGTP diphosphatase|nr:NUDIX domain-containing protein [Bacillota bacterium]